MQDSLLKQCTKCGELKSITKFNKRTASKDGLRSQCRDCDRKDKQKWDVDNKQHCLEYSEQYRKQNKQKIKKYNKEYYSKNQEKLKEYSKQYKQGNVEIVRNQYKKNFNYYSMLNAINFLLKGKIQTSKVFDKLPYTLQQLKSHLESQFTPEMTWNNYGDYWEIDHIIPINTFNLSSSDEPKFKICWSLANLRPLEKSLNRSRPKDGSDISEKLRQQILGQIASYNTMLV